eukprot:g2123.t1
MSNQAIGLAELTQLTLSKIHALQAPHTAAQIRRKADQWLTDFIQNDRAWNVADALLSRQKNNSTNNSSASTSLSSNYYAAQVLHIKIQQDFSTLGDAEATLQSLLNTLINYIEYFHDCHPSQSIVRTRLCMALAALLVQLGPKGQQVCGEILTSWAQKGPSYMKTLLTLLVELPDQAMSQRLRCSHANRRGFLGMLSGISINVHTCILQQYEQTKQRIIELVQANNNTGGSLTPGNFAAGNNNDATLSLSFQCFAQWCSLPQTRLPPSDLASHDRLFHIPFEAALSCHPVDNPKIFGRAADTLIELFVQYSNPHTDDMLVITKIIPEMGRLYQQFLNICKRAQQLRQIEKQQGSGIDAASNNGSVGNHHHQGEKTMFGGPKRDITNESDGYNLDTYASGLWRIMLALGNSWIPMIVSDLDMKDMRVQILAMMVSISEYQGVTSPAFSAKDSFDFWGRLAYEFGQLEEWSRERNHHTNNPGGGNQQNEGGSISDTALVSQLRDVFTPIVGRLFNACVTHIRDTAKSPDHLWCLDEDCGALRYEACETILDCTTLANADLCMQAANQYLHEQATQWNQANAKAANSSIVQSERSTIVSMVASSDTGLQSAWEGIETGLALFEALSRTIRASESSITPHIFQLLLTPDFRNLQPLPVRLTAINFVGRMAFWLDMNPKPFFQDLFIWVIEGLTLLQRHRGLQTYLNKACLQNNTTVDKLSPELYEEGIRTYLAQFKMMDDKGGGGDMIGRRTGGGSSQKNPPRFPTPSGSSDEDENEFMLMKKIGEASATALGEMCHQCYSHIDLNFLFRLCNLLVTDVYVKCIIGRDNQCAILDGIGRVIGALQSEQQVREALQNLSGPLLYDLDHQLNIIQQEGFIPENREKRVVTLIDMLTSVMRIKVRALTPTSNGSTSGQHGSNIIHGSSHKGFIGGSDNTTIGGRGFSSSSSSPSVLGSSASSEATQAHPTVDLLKKMWPNLNRIKVLFHNKEFVIEKVTRLYKHALRNAKCAAYPIVSEMLHVIVDGFRSTLFSSWLYLASVAVEVFSQEGASRNHTLESLARMNHELGHITFVLLTKKGEIVECPDIVEDYFRLQGRYVNHTPELLFTFSDSTSFTSESIHSQSIPSLDVLANAVLTRNLRLVSAAIPLEHKAANVASLGFLIHLCQTSTPRKSVMNKLLNKSGLQGESLTDNDISALKFRDILLQIMKLPSSKSTQQQPRTLGWELVANLLLAIANDLPIQRVDEEGPNLSNTLFYLCCIDPALFGNHISSFLSTCIQYVSEPERMQAFHELGDVIETVYDLSPIKQTNVNSQHQRNSASSSPNRAVSHRKGLERFTTILANFAVICRRSLRRVQLPQG